MRYIINHVDTCTSDYFSGHHLPVVQVLVGGTTTYSDIKESLLDYQTFEHIYEDYKMQGDFNLDTYTTSIENMFDNFTTLDYVPDSLYGLEDFDSEDYNAMNPCYMFFSIELDLSEELEALQTLRNQGYAVVYYEPVEFEGINRDTLEDLLSLGGDEAIAEYNSENN